MTPDSSRRHGHAHPSAEVDDLLLAALLALAEDGAGTVLGLVAPGRSGLRRVARAGAELARRFEEAFRTQNNALVRYATSKISDRSRAEDAVQRAYEAVWRAHQVRPREIENLDAYVFTAVANEVNRELRVVIPQRRRTEELDEATEVVDGAHDATASVADLVHLRAVLARLTRREREAVVLRFQWQLSVNEAAEVMGVTAGAVKRYSSDGLARLRSALSDSETSAVRPGSFGASG